MEKKIKIFGAALDASDFPLNIQMKHSYLHSLHDNLISEKDLLDPYDAMLLNSKIIPESKYLKMGKLLIDSWLTPKPNINDFSRINQLEFQRATHDGTINKYSKKIEEYMESFILPGIPLMIGVDHALTGGVLRALTKEYGAERIIVVILDAHFDGIPADISLNLAKYLKDHPKEIDSLLSEQSIHVDDHLEINNTYTCASFLYYLLDEKIILPENLIILGCQDYPNQKLRLIKDSRIEEYVKYFDIMEEKGVIFIPKMEISQMVKNLTSKLNSIDKSLIYISFDVDVGGLKEILAARFRNAIGMDKSEILKVGQVIKNFMISKNCKLIGLDVMEIEIHLLGKIFPKSGRRDLTIKVIDEFLGLFI